jgi:hypothetical protein
MTAPALLGLVLGAATALAACGGASQSPSPEPAATARPTPTPVPAEVTTPEDAAALVIAANPLFAGAMPDDPNVIGASKWWTSEPLPGGGFRIEITVGWGDCVAGCIDRHVWTYEVRSDGVIELISENGPDVAPGV